MDDILKEIEEENIDQDTNKKVDDIVRENPALIDKYPILEIEYNRDGSKKKFYHLANEKDIKKTQIESDQNELDFKLSQKTITKEEYDKQKELLELKLTDQNIVYDNLIFELIKNEELEELKKQIKEANLNDIDLKRLATSLASIAENKIDEFQRNNKEFRENNISYWNYKYNNIAKNYAKTREIESYILSLIE